MPLQEYVREIEVPEDVQVEIRGESVIKVKGKLGELEKDLSHADVTIEKDSNVIRVKFLGKGRKAEALIGTIASIIRNMITGVREGFTYKMKIVASHFPMSVKVQGDKVLIENFIGERTPRIAKIVGSGTKVEVRGDDVIVKGIDKEAVGQTAANIELATKIRGKDPRKFLDGIYVYEKKVGLE
ncbi:MAG: 50S ribosomal protein L6 [Thaumarchaeota archaeon]|nr:50S ribosomal protein L6 [Nitrososphaerota archaeon]